MPTGSTPGHGEGKGPNGSNVIDIMKDSDYDPHMPNYLGKPHKPQEFSNGSYC